MAKNPYFQSDYDLQAAYEELDHITKLLIQRDIMLTETNIELEDKNRALENARQEILNTSEYLNNLLAYSPDGIWVLDTFGCVIYFNKVAEAITGYSANEIMCRPLDFLFAEPDRYKNFIATIPAGGHFTNWRTRIRKKNGESAELLMSLSLLRQEGERGQPIGFMAIFKDITREIRLEEALREANERLEEKVRQRTHDLEILSQTLLVLNQVSTVASQSLELETLLNNILSLVLELTGFGMGAISTLEKDGRLTVRSHINMAPEILESIRTVERDQGAIGRAAASGTLQVSEPDVPFAMESGIQLEVAVPLRAKGSIQGVMTLFSKVERKVLDEEWDIFMAIGVQAGWAIENAQLYEQVKDDVVKLKEVDRIKTEFIATVSHELRTPLTSIIGFLSYAQTALDNLDQKKLGRYIHIALENSQKLAHMIEDLLAMQKLDSGNLRLNLEPILMRDLLEEIGKDLGPQLQAKEQSLALVVPENLPLLQADREQMERALTNLIVTPIKFSATPATIRVAAKHEPHGRGFRITVADTGIGMSPAIREKIFERFFQAENTLTRKIGGVGLGLTIAKRIVEMHGGAIEVESELHRGSCFSILLPESLVIPKRATAGSAADGVDPSLEV